MGGSGLTSSTGSASPGTTYTYPSSNTDTKDYGGKPFYEWSWEDSCALKRLTFAVHGLGRADGTFPAGWLQNPTPSDDADWAGAWGAQGDHCKKNTISADVHSNM